MTYTPDRWVVLDIDDGKGNKLQKVFAGWYGGYAGSDSWQMNSGITKVVDEGEYFDFHGYSGSIYRCHKGAYGMSMYMGGVYNSILEKVPEGSISIAKEYENA